MQIFKMDTKMGQTQNIILINSIYVLLLYTIQFIHEFKS